MTHALGYCTPCSGIRRREPSPWLVAGAIVGIADVMKHPLDYAGPLTNAWPTAHGRLREWLIWFAIGAVVAIGGVRVLAIVVTKFDSGPRDERFGQTRAAVSNLSTALDAFAADTGRYPSDVEGLGALCSRPAGLAGWKGPYLQQLTRDPWGRRYVYHLGGPSGGAGFRVLSMGRDGKEGTADDVAGGSDAAPPGPSDRPTMPAQQTDPG